MSHNSSETIEIDGRYYNVGRTRGDILSGPHKTLEEALRFARARSQDVPLRRGKDDPGELSGPKLLFLLAKRMKDEDLPNL